MNILPYVSLLMIAYGFFMAGYYTQRRQSIKRLRKFVGQPMNFGVLFYVINGKELKDK